MSDFETTEMKLRSTPTGGVAGEHSPYYRRLLSAGYKGYIQGTIGGAGLYGFLGLAAGALVALPALPFIGVGALALIPVAAGIGVMKGAGTFGNIGSIAAISAESADMAEQRRYLLDRYYELPDGPEGDKQAEIIKQELSTLNHTDRPHPLLHWKTVAVCAAIGGALALAFFSPLGPAVFGETLVAHALHGLAALGETMGLEAVITHAGAHGATWVATALGATLGVGVGAAAGAMIGIDRHYVRGWFDKSEQLIHDESHAREAIEARQQQVERLRAAVKADEETRKILERRGNLRLDQASNTMPEPQAAVAPVPLIAVAPVADLDRPSTKVSSAHLESRLADIQHAMQIPVV